MAFELTVRQSAEMLGVTEARVHQLIKDGLLPAELVAGRYFLDDDAVRARAERAPKAGRPPKSVRQKPRAFTLMNREHEVLDLVYDDNSDEFVQATRLLDASRAPLGIISPRGKKVSLAALTYWWRHRSIPFSRQGMEAKLAELGLADPARIPFASLGLSLSDQYWIRPQGENIDWREVNFFGNAFPEMAFDGWLSQVGLDSPDNTSEGQLPKRWLQKDGRAVLAKGGSSLNQEPFNEACATALHRRLLGEGDYVAYRLGRFGPAGGAVSLCDNFLSDEEEYIPAYYVMKATVKTPSHTTYQHYLECCSILGAHGAGQALAKMIVTDDILGNTDRHLRNFGLIRNVETLECRCAPLFDTGSSLLCGKPLDALAAGDLSFSPKPFSDEANQQLRLVSDYSWFDVRALDGFPEEAAGILGQNPALEPRIPYIRTFIESRIARLAVIAS